MATGNKKISTRLKSYAGKKGLKAGSSQANRYVYGGLTNIKKKMKGKKKP